jgi:unsaturated chondroitin disaccharide hydrolase
MTVSSAPDEAMVEAALNTAWETIRRTIPRMGLDRPQIGLPDLTYQRCGPSDWVDGFWSGQLWLAYEQTSDPVFLDAARAQLPYFADRLDRPESHTHDLGFLYTCSAVAAYKVTGDPAMREMGIAAADALTKRYNPRGRFIQAWNPSPQDTPEQAARKHGKIIVDCLENLALLYWATNETGNARYAEIADAHAETSMTHLVHPDGSTYHTFDFDPETGAPLGGSTHQGFADASCWSRGQSWAIHGLTIAFGYTDNDRYLQTACQLADYALTQLSDDGVPLWDYRLTPDAPQYRDSSAGAIMAAGLFALADALGEGSNADRYRASAQTIIATLMRAYTTADEPHAEGLLVHGASHVSAGRADAMLPYGDYFYLEALLRALDRTHGYW